MKLAFYIAKYGNYQDKAVSLFTLGKYSHVELVFSNDQWFSSSPRNNGTRFKNIIDNNGHWDYIQLKVTPGQELTIRHWCENEVNKPYDWLGVLGIITSKDLYKNYKWYCSEICLSALLQSEIINYKTNQISPSKLYKIMETFK